MELLGMPVEYDDIKITFDDSIIEDDNAKRKEAREEVSAGLMSKESYMELKGMSEEEAQEELSKIEADNKIILPEGMDFMGMNDKAEE